MLFFILSAFLASVAAEIPDTTSSVCPVVQIEAVRLPDLNIPRADHSLFCVNGEPTVVGGHTSGFVPTATAEYYRNGKWHQISTVYTHDNGFCLPLRSGQVLIGGGHAEPLGIGHTYSVEMYDPETHSFRGFGCLDTKRCFASAAQLENGQVVISGNWYQGADNIEVFDGHKSFVHQKEVSQQRSRPFILPISKDDALIFSGVDKRDEPFDTIVVDRLQGAPLRVPLLDRWKPLEGLEDRIYDAYFVGEREKCIYSYLLPVEDKGREQAFCRIDGMDFSLLATDAPIPLEHDGHPIRYQDLRVDREVLRAHLFGFTPENGNVYVLSADLSTTPAALTLYYATGLPAHVYYRRPVLTSEGNLLLAGGKAYPADVVDDNFSPHAMALLLPVGRYEETAGAASSWLWWLLGTAAAAGITFFLMKRRRHKTPVTRGESYKAPLLQHLTRLMEDQKQFLNSDLKLQDVADLLGTNRTYLTNNIKAATGQTFTQYVNTYRVEYAKELLSSHPDEKISAIWAESGFATESSFFRTFKAVTGTTPSEWKGQTN